MLKYVTTLTEIKTRAELVNIIGEMYSSGVSEDDLNLEIIVYS